MINLAGHARADELCRRELHRCGIEIVEAPDRKDEVPARCTGKLGAFTFDRAWYYWRAHGPMPLEVAEGLYATPVGKTDIRAGGHCGCPPPAEQATHYGTSGKKLARDSEQRCPESWKDHESESLRKIYSECASTVEYVPDPAAASVRAVVEAFHIDSELGLYLFADAVRRLVAS